MTDFRKVLVTGANGAVGRHLVRFLTMQANVVIAGARQIPDVTMPASVIFRKMPSLEDKSADWFSFVKGCDVIVHLAGLAHVAQDDPRHTAVNSEATASIVHAASQSGTKHFIYISSIAAQVGASSPVAQTEDVHPSPETIYGQSKLSAEAYVRACGLPYTIFRPAAISGVGKGSLSFLNKIARLPLPLPVGGLVARRSFLSIENLCSAVDFVLRKPSDSYGTFVLADAVPTTIRDLVANERLRLGRSPMMLSMPPGLLKAGLLALGKRRLWSQIGEPLVIDPGRLISLGWKPFA